MTTTAATKRRAPELPSSIAAATWRNAEHSTDAIVDVCDGSGSNCSVSGDTHLGLTVVLPDGSHMIVEVDSNQSMIDLLVHLCSRLRVSPTDHVIVIPSEVDPRYPVQYTASQSLHSLHSLGVTTVHLALKRTAERRRQSIEQQLPFEMTHRVIINLPHNHKQVVRVRPDIVLRELFQIAIEHRDLDADRYELRHPTQPEVLLDFAAPLNQYGVAEVNVVERQFVEGHRQRHELNASTGSLNNNGTEVVVTGRHPTGVATVLPCASPSDVTRSGLLDSGASRLHQPLEADVVPSALRLPSSEPHPAGDMSAVSDSASPPKKRGFLRGIFSAKKSSVSRHSVASPSTNAESLTLTLPISTSTLPHSKRSTWSEDAVQSDTLPHSSPRHPALISSMSAANENEVAVPPLRQKRQAPGPPPSAATTASTPSDAVTSIPRQTVQTVVMKGVSVDVNGNSSSAIANNGSNSPSSSLSSGFEDGQLTSPSAGQSSASSPLGGDSGVVSSTFVQQARSFSVHSNGKTTTASDDYDTAVSVAAPERSRRRAPEPPAPNGQRFQSSSSSAAVVAVEFPPTANVKDKDIQLDADRIVFVAPPRPKPQRQNPPRQIQQQQLEGLSTLDELVSQVDPSSSSSLSTGVASSRTPGHVDRGEVKSSASSEPLYATVMKSNKSVQNGEQTMSNSAVTTDSSEAEAADHDWNVGLVEFPPPTPPVIATSSRVSVQSNDAIDAQEDQRPVVIQSALAEEEDDDDDDGEDKDHLTTSVGLYTYSVGNLPSFQAERSSNEVTSNSRLTRRSVVIEGTENQPTSKMAEDDGNVDALTSSVGLYTYSVGNLPSFQPERSSISAVVGPPVDEAPTSRSFRRSVVVDGNENESPAIKMTSDSQGQPESSRITFTADSNADNDGDYDGGEVIVDKTTASRLVVSRSLAAVPSGRDDGVEDNRLDGAATYNGTGRGPGRPSPTNLQQQQQPSSSAVTRIHIGPSSTVISGQHSSRGDRLEPEVRTHDGSLSSKSHLASKAIDADPVSSGSTRIRITAGQSTAMTNGRESIVHGNNDDGYRSDRLPLSHQAYATNRIESSSDDVQPASSALVTRSIVSDLSLSERDFQSNPHSLNNVIISDSASASFQSPEGQPEVVDVGSRDRQTRSSVRVTSDGDVVVKSSGFDASVAVKNSSAAILGSTSGSNGITADDEEDDKHVSTEFNVVDADTLAVGSSSVSSGVTSSLAMPTSDVVGSVLRDADSFDMVTTKIDSSNSSTSSLMKDDRVVDKKISVVQLSTNAPESRTVQQSSRTGGKLQIRSASNSPSHATYNSLRDARQRDNEGEVWRPETIMINKTAVRPVHSNVGKSDTSSQSFPAGTGAMTRQGVPVAAAVVDNSQAVGLVKPTVSGAVRPSLVKKLTVSADDELKSIPTTSTASNKPLETTRLASTNLTTASRSSVIVGATSVTVASRTSPTIVEEKTREMKNMSSVREPNKSDAVSAPSERRSIVASTSAVSVVAGAPMAVARTTVQSESAKQSSRAGRAPSTALINAAEKSSTDGDQVAGSSTGVYYGGVRLKSVTRPTNTSLVMVAAVQNTPLGGSTGVDDGPLDLTKLKHIDVVAMDGELSTRAQQVAGEQDVAKSTPAAAPAAAAAAAGGKAPRTAGSVEKAYDSQVDGVAREVRGTTMTAARNIDDDQLSSSGVTLTTLKVASSSTSSKAEVTSSFVPKQQAVGSRGTVNIRSSQSAITLPTATEIQPSPQMTVARSSTESSTKSSSLKNTSSLVDNGRVNVGARVNVVSCGNAAVRPEHVASSSPDDNLSTRVRQTRSSPTIVATGTSDKSANSNNVPARQPPPGGNQTSQSGVQSTSGVPSNDVRVSRHSSTTINSKSTLVIRSSATNEEQSRVTTSSNQTSTKVPVTRTSVVRNQPSNNEDVEKANDGGVGSLFGVKLKSRSKSETNLSMGVATSLSLAPRDVQPPPATDTVDGTIPTTGSKPPVGIDVSKRQSQSQPKAAAQPTASSPPVPLASIITSPLGVAAVLRPAKPHQSRRVIEPPPLTLHEQLMTAIRSAPVLKSRSTSDSDSNAAPTAMLDDSDKPSLRTRSTDVDGQSTSTTSTMPQVVTSPSKIRRTTSAPSGSVLLTVPPPPPPPPASDSTDITKSSSSSSSRPKFRLLDPPKLSARDELMLAIRNAGGSAKRRTGDATEGENVVNGPHNADDAPPPTGVTSGKMAATVSTKQSATGPTDTKFDVPPPVAPPIAALTKSSAPPTAGNAKPTTSTLRVSRSLPPPQPGTDPREELLAAIRNAAGGKTLKKTSMSTN